MKTESLKLSWAGRLRVAWACFSRALKDPSVAGRLAAALEPVVPAPKPVAVPPERQHASGLALLAALQREGRLVDFLQEDMAGYPDADVGAAARVVHMGCRKVLGQYVDLKAVRAEQEGATVSVPAGFDAQRIRLTGNVAGQPPYRGTLKHHGWEAAAVRFPQLSESLDPRVIAPAEVEL